MDDVFIKLLNMSLSASWLILAVIVVRLLLKKAPKWCICLLWGLVAMKLVCPFSLESIFSLIPSNEVIPENIALEPHPQIHSGITYVDTVVNPVMEQNFAPNIGDSVNPLQVVVAIAGVVWCIGMVCCLLYSIASFMILKHRVSASKKIREKVYACDEVKSPFILGIFRPVIYVPSGMSDEVLEYVLAHENAHLKRGDHFWKPLGFLILSVYWFNPMCWAAYMLLCRDIEYACDEKVIRGKDDEYAVSYSQALLDCNVQRRIIAACPLAFGETGVKSRVKGILDYKKPAFWVIIVAVIVCTVVAVCFLTNPTGTDDVADITDDFGPTLPGADEIYPTILVDGDCYQWRRGRAVMNEDVVNHADYDPEIFLKDMVLYGEIIKESGDHPEHDRGLVCVFDASGTVYLDPHDENVVYLWLTTDWFEDGVIAFDKVNSSDENEEDVKENNLYLENDPPRVTGLGLNGYTGYMDEFYAYTNEFTECDYDGDGKTDRLYRIDDVAYNMSEYRIDFGNGDKLYSGNVSGTAYPHVYPVDLDKDGDNDMVLTYTVEPADREPFTWCDIYNCDKHHHIYMKDDSVLRSIGGISHLPVKLQRISSREASFTVVDTDYSGFVGLDRYYDRYDNDMLDQFWEMVESDGNIINSMIVFAEVKYGDEPCVHCYADIINGGWHYLVFDIVFEDGEYRIKNINKCFDPFSIDFSDSYVPGIIPTYVPSDVMLEKVQISSDKPYEGMITSICDFDEDGRSEKVVVDYRDILAEGSAVPGRIAVYDTDDNILWTDMFALAYAGWCRFYISEIDNIPCLMRYFPPVERQGSWECALWVYTLNSDNEFIVSEQISCDGTKESAEECKIIAERYLEHAIMLVSTTDSELKVYK